jgi:hypothetical protein
VPPLPLTGGFYVARSIIADAQRCVNLYPEKNPADSPQPYAMYPTPGLSILATAGTNGWRGLWLATDGMVYGVCGLTVYQITVGLTLKPLGQLQASVTTPVGICDNGSVLIIVDGSPQGYAIDLTKPARPFAQITDGNFLGATRVDYVDTFFLFNEPGTNSWYSSLSDITYADLTGVQGAIQSGDIAVGGTGYVSGTYNNVPLTGGNGTGATGNFTIVGGVVVAMVLVLPGKNYRVGDPLGVAPVSVGGSGTNFSWTVGAVQPSAFDPTYVAQKTGFPDHIATLMVMHREIWLLGTQRTSEVWYNAGNAGFPFAIAPGVYIEHGCIAPYSVAKHDLNVFWLGADKDGRATVFVGANYAARPISTPAIAAIFSTYASVSDAIGMTYKQQDHVFYVLTFPTANVTWTYDLTENLWHQRTWTDSNGGENRVRWQALAYAGPNYGDVILAGDWQTGQLYSLDLTAESDNGAAVVRRRTFEHLVGDGRQIVYPGFRLDCEVGVYAPPGEVTFYLRWSDDRGRTFGNPVPQVAVAGDYIFQPKWSNLGRARDRVFEVFWSDPYVAAVAGAWLDPEPVKTGA